jgi:pyruvate/2-oxoglutarate dehydrogenase complex dihydrolipoamide dehydrogenase (E3) component
MPGHRDRYDLVVIGMGSAGIIAAKFAAEQLGLRVAAVERGRVGGDCLWTGCVPTKTLIASARVARTVHTADRLAVGAGDPAIDLAAIWARIDEVRNGIAASDDSPDRLRASGIDLLEGEATLVGPQQVRVGDRIIDTRYVLICTGSRPLTPPIEGLADIGADVRVTSSESFFDEPPSGGPLAIIGGGPVGCEVGQAVRRLGLSVTIIQRAPRLLPADDPQHAARLLRILRDEGVVVHLSRQARQVRRSGAGVGIELDDGEVVEAGQVMVAAGRTPNVEGLDLDAAGVARTPRGITVDARSRTTVSTIYAAGDVTGGTQFTHSAANAAVLAVRDMFLPGRGRRPSLVPWCTFTDPEVAHVGLTEAEAVARHGRRRVAAIRHDLAHSDRARADGTTDGEILIVTFGTRIVGGHAICPGAGELIHELALAIHTRTSITELAQVVHVYPTIATTINEIAAGVAYTTANRLRWLAKLGRLWG